MDNRKFVQFKKRTWLHRHNPFQPVLKFHLRRIVGVNPSAKTHFPATVTDQGETEECFEKQTCQIQNSVDGIQYDPQQLLAAVCQYLNIPVSQYSGTDVQTGGAVLISPGLTPIGQTVPTVHFDAMVEIFPEQGMDLYDTIQYYVTTYQRPVGAGTLWYNDWEQGSLGIVPNVATNSLGGHFVGYYGKVQSPYLNTSFSDEDRMDNAGTWGIEAQGSAQGHYLFARDTVNEWGMAYGGYMPITTTSPVVKILGQLSAAYIKLADWLGSIGTKTTGYPPPVHTSLIPALAQGIFEAEGNGLQAGMKYNNRGDLRGRPGNKYLASLGVTGYGENNLAIFPDLATGDKACVQLCTDVANNLLLAYSKPCTIQQFAKTYGDPQTQQEWDDYVATLLKNIGNGKVENDTITSLL